MSDRLIVGIDWAHPYYMGYGSAIDKARAQRRLDRSSRVRVVKRRAELARRKGQVISD